MYLLHVDDIVRVVRNFEIVLFAEYTMSYVTGEDLNEMIKTTDKESQSLFEYIYNNYLSIDAKKSEYCVFSEKS